MKTTPPIPFAPLAILLALAVFAFASFSSYASSATSSANSSSATAAAASAEEKPNPILAKLGGLVTESMDNMPEVAILDMREDRGDFKLASDVAAQMTEMMRVPFRVKENAEVPAGASPLAAAAALASATNRVAAIILCEDGSNSLPLLLAAPEARWAVVNAAPLKAGSPSAAVLESRIRKELWRAAAFAMGASHSEFPLCLMKPVFAPADLDALPVSEISAEPLSGIRQQFRALGITPARKSFYRKACEEGWAPPPTNDIQRAIWDAAAAKRQKAE